MTVVYVIQAEGGPIKVGVATYPKKRLATLRTAAPFPLSLAHVQEVEDAKAYAIERAAHALLGETRLHGEWFSASVEDAKRAIADALEGLNERPAFEEPGRGASLNMRLTPSFVATMKEAASGERRSLTNFIEVVMADWLRANGYLKG